MKEDDSLLPALPDEELDLSSIIQPPIEDVPANAALTTIRKNDIELATASLKVVQECWNHATSFSRVMRLLKETRDAVKFRREVLGLPYGSQGASTKGNDFEPIDM